MRLSSRATSKWFDFVMPCQAMSMVVVHVASGTRDILVFWAVGRGYWPRLTDLLSAHGAQA
jgi:hypothetical protein